jgi:hypothetical protein
MFGTRMRLSLSLVAILGGSALLTAAQPGQGARMRTPTYDPKTETRVEGAVQEVTDVSPPAAEGRRSLGGTHVALKTATEVLNVHLGPTTYMNQTNLDLAPGQTIVVVGSQVTIDGEAIVIAREVTRGATVWTLRDAAGRPAWRAGPR